MNKFVLFAAFLFAGIGDANAAVRSASSVTRKTDTTATQSARSTTKSRATSVVTRNATQSRAKSNVTARTARTTNVTTTSPRSAISTTQKKSRTATRTTTAAPTSRTARSATAARASVTSTSFGTGYNACRDAYFTCMDQFCAQQDEAYRRCTCSKRIDEIKSRERNLTNTADQLADFKDLNIDVIPKTAAEVKAMITASAGESVAASVRDTSDSAQKLAGISDVLSTSKKKSLSTQGTLDIAGDINAIWATTDLAAGTTIANLTGTALYNAVHSQCAEMVSDGCGTPQTLNMVVSAYAMYIENDCATLSAALDKKYTAANASIRATESEMHSARLENYDAHNATSINDCVALVRSDITANTACGENYVHCLDVSGKYLNRDTGAPIYTAEFYQLESAISLGGDVLANQTNKLLVAELNRKRTFAEHSLDTCRDLADDVWDEFMRQAISEIYQGQQAKIRQVREECLDVVNKCYDEKSNSLKDFSEIKEQTLGASRLELSEELCKTKLDACSNLYGGGNDGMSAMIVAMTAITDQKIGMQCQETLRDYAREICAIPANDTVHSYPYGCRTYAPGEQRYATIELCNDALAPQTLSEKYVLDTTNLTLFGTDGYSSCIAQKTYSACRPGYSFEDGNCTKCSTISDCGYDGSSCHCPGGTEKYTVLSSSTVQCGNYAGSLYQKMVRYARQVCVRPSESGNTLPSNILQDVNIVMDSVRSDMAKTLSAECTRLGGQWVDFPTTTEKISNPFTKFYDNTSSNTEWGYCREKDSSIACKKAGGAWNISTNTCVCDGIGDGLEWDALSETCVCKTGSNWDGTQCVTCPTLSTWTESLSKCVCDGGRDFNSDKTQCLYNQPETACTKTNGNWDKDTQTCTCTRSYSWGMTEWNASQDVKLHGCNGA